MIARCLREWRPGQDLDTAFDRAVTPGPRRAAGPEGATHGALVRLTRTEPGLRAVWLQTYDEAEPAFAHALAERAGLPPDDLRPTIQAAMFNAALRAAVEHYAWSTADAPTRRRRRYIGGGTGEGDALGARGGRGRECGDGRGSAVTGEGCGGRTHTFR
ncbi:hypothetical protein [Streptomyces sp. NPDC052610]|uniref:acyl-CoA-like ligand-binding transcription factor n=1 Tax=Streptomyces sp. NPDC052610 TaxID=3154952 RepID=UPI00341BAFA6